MCFSSLVLSRRPKNPQKTSQILKNSLTPIGSCRDLHTARVRVGGKNRRPSSAGKRSDTALIIATRRGYPEIIANLLNHDALTDARNEDGIKRESWQLHLTRRLINIAAALRGRLIGS